MYRGLGEVAVAIGFGPLMLLGAYVVQTGGVVTREAVVASLPIALLVALILYVNEIPDRRGDARAGKRTLPVRFSRDAVITGYRVAAAAAYVIVAVGVVVGLLPLPALLALLTVPLALQVSRGLGPELRQPVRPDGDHGREHQGPPLRGAAADRRVPGRPRRRGARALGRPVPRLRPPPAAGVGSPTPYDLAVISHRQHRWLMLRSSFWFTPGAHRRGLRAAGAGPARPRLVARGAAWSSSRSGGADGARALLTTIAGSMITVVGVGFSITIVALVLASTQFGPRLLTLFMRDVTSQVDPGDVRRHLRLLCPRPPNRSRPG